MGVVHLVKEQTLSLCLTAIKAHFSILSKVRDIKSIEPFISENEIMNGLNSSEVDVVNAYKQLKIFRKIRESDELAQKITNDSWEVKYKPIKMKL